MTFEDKIIKSSRVKETKLYRAATKAKEAPDTGVKIIKKSAYYVIRDSAKIALDYIPHIVYSKMSSPLNTLGGVFTLDEIEDFVKRAEKNVSTQLLLDLILKDIDIPPSTTVSTAPLVFDDTETDDIYGDYENDIEEDDVEVVGQEKDVLQILVEAFKPTE